MPASTEPSLLRDVAVPYKETGVTSLPLGGEETRQSVQMPIFQKCTVSTFLALGSTFQLAFSPPEHFLQGVES